jgi:hypothetical protein
VIYEYLMKFDVRSVIPTGNFQNHIPETDIQKVIIRNNRDKLLYFLEDLINQEDTIFKNEEAKYKNCDLFTEFKLWMSRNNMKLEYNNIAFHSRLGQLMKKKINTKEILIRKDTNQNTFIELQKLRDFFVKLNE